MTVLPPDDDGDGRPNSADLCITVVDPLQADGDGDGFGDACDADLDGDLRVGTADLDRITACIGVTPAEPATCEPAAHDLRGRERG